MVFSKREAGRFPDDGEVLEALLGGTSPGSDT
jgi:hypothetical protein